MRLIIEPTNSNNVSFGYPKVCIEVASDDLNISEVLETLFIPALLALGYSKEAIESSMGIDK